MTFPLQETQIFIDGPVGPIEAMVQSSEVPINWLAVICHPNPLQEGTMNNKVVTTLQRTFRMLGMATVRFNFRGVGKSAGKYGYEVGELADLIAVIAWARAAYPQAKLCLAGFSFGGYISYCAANTVKADCLISITLTVTHHDFDCIGLPTMPWILVQGDQDEVIDPVAVFKWVEKQQVKPIILEFKDATHFFHGRLIELRERLSEALTRII